MVLSSVGAAVLPVPASGASAAIENFPVKRQLSPAATLDAQLEPYLAAYNDPLVKRHISPAFNIEEDVGNMRNLFNVGKRQVSMADDVGRQMQMYSQLFDVGKKRSISPSFDLSDRLGYADFLSRAGRR